MSNTVNRRIAAATLLGAAVTFGSLAFPQPSHAQTLVRIGVLNVYSDFQGPGSVLAAQMAAEDFAKDGKLKVEVVSADHQNKADVGAGITRSWIDTDNVHAIVDLPNSAVALAANQIVRDKNRVLLASGAGSAAMTGAQCSPNTVHWTYDTWAYGHSLGRAVHDQGGKSWYFITADYAFGHDLEKQATDEVVAQGGKVLGAVRHPLGALDFSSFLLQAQASKADVVAFANAGGDLTNALKQAAEFGLGKDQKLVGLIFGITNVPGLGLQASSGLMSVAPFYWDLNDGTRAWAKRFQARHPKKMMPNDMHAGVYASIMHYLKAVEKVGDPTSGTAVVETMKATPTDDPLFGQGTIRADGRKLHPMYLLQVKTPQESSGEWDYMKVLATIPGEQAFRPMADGGCPLVK
ncbi:MAG TPA: ABC transporter substrate-binding protein [Burkholderiaceae bacterium]|nr:ABC transporter substrate-binding protein [Burkholderiaceae bacterium]